jgi:hypothetical protein
MFHNILEFKLAHSGQVVHLGSKTRSIYTPKNESANFSFSFELRHISLARPGDIIVLRKNKVPWDYINYHQSLIKGNINVVEVEEDKKNRNLSLPQLLIQSPDSINKIKKFINKNAVLIVWDSTKNEQKVADTLGIPLWGSPRINQYFGHKSGARILAERCGLRIPYGKSCHTKKEVLDFLNTLKHKEIKKVVIKYDESYGGIGHLVIENLNKNSNKKVKVFLNAFEQNLGGGWTIEQWVQSKKTIGSHIEINTSKEVYLSYLWQQIIDKDHVSYNGAIPLNVEKKHFDLLTKYMQIIGNFISSEGGQGSFGPDFMIGKDNKIYFNELNARIPSTAFPLQITMQIVGHIPKGFLATSIKIENRTKFKDLKLRLEQNNLLYPNKYNYGVILYHVGQLEWGNFYFVIISDSQKKSQQYYKKIIYLFEK